MMEIDLTGVDAWEAGMILPPGEYHVEVDDAKEGTSSGGNPQVELEMRAVEGENKGGTIRDWVTVTPGSLGRVKQVLEALGVSNLDGKVSFEAKELVGKHCRVILRSELYEGKDRTKVMAYQPVGAATNGNAAPSTADDKTLPF